MNALAKDFATMKRPLKLNHMVLLVSALTLSGCALGPEYQRPEVALPAQFPDQAMPSTTQTTQNQPVEVAPQWWTLFGDTELVRLVDLALAHNTDLQQASARVDQAESLMRQARAAQWPSVEIGANGSRARASTTTAQPSNGSVDNTFRLAGSTAFELDFWGRLRRASEAARAQVLATHYAQEVVRQTVAGLVTQGYFGLQVLDQQIVLTLDTLETRSEELKLQRLRVERGIAREIDFEQAEGQRADAALQLRDMKRQRELMQWQLGLLTGQPGLQILDTRSARLSLPPLPPPGLPSALLERRPDVRQAEQLLASANAQIGVAKAAMFPTLSLTGLAGGESGDLSDLLKGGSRIWSLGFGLSLPIFDAGRRLAETDRAQARQVEAVAAYQGAVQSAFKDVADALSNVQAARDSQSDARIRELAALNSLTLARKRYDAGYSSHLDMLDAQRTANSAQLQALTIRQSQYTSTVDLFKALGGGWDPGRK